MNSVLIGLLAVVLSLTFAAPIFLAIIALPIVLLINYLHYRDLRKCGECSSLTIIEFLRRIFASRSFLIAGDKPAATQPLESE